jgi:hypothetical protein
MAQGRIGSGRCARSGKELDVAGVHRLSAVCATQVDTADLAAGVCRYRTGGPAFPASHLAPQPTITVSRSTSSTPDYLAWRPDNPG